MRMLGTVGLGEAVVLEHVKKGSLSSVIKSEENNVGTFLEEAHPFKRTFEEVDDEHFFFYDKYIIF